MESSKSLGKKTNPNSNPNPNKTNNPKIEPGNLRGFY